MNLLYRALPADDSAAAKIAVAPTGEVGFPTYTIGCLKPTAVRGQT